MEAEFECSRDRAVASGAEARDWYVIDDKYVCPGCVTPADKMRGKPMVAAARAELARRELARRRVYRGDHDFLMELLDAEGSWPQWL